MNKFLFWKVGKSGMKKMSFGLQSGQIVSLSGWSALQYAW